MEDALAEDITPGLVPVSYEVDQELAQEFLIELEEGEIRSWSTQWAKVMCN